MNKITIKRQSRKRRVFALAKKSNRLVQLLVTRSNKAIYAQLIDNITGDTIASVSSIKSGKNNTAEAVKIGKEIADIAKKKKITDIVFNRNYYKFHGRVKALAESAREAGLII